MLFPLSLGSQGSCRIGGNISTNAGGTGVVAYGNTRSLVLGLEVVLPNGDIWDGMRALRKDNTGYDLKQLFIGAEGTLGIVTAAVLRLFPKPRGVAVAIAGMRFACERAGAVPPGAGARRPGPHRLRADGPHEHRLRRPTSAGRTRPARGAACLVRARGDILGGG